MENVVLMVFAIVGVALASIYVPLIGLVAVAWGSFVWFHTAGAIVVTLFYVRHCGAILVWPSWPAPPPPK